MTKTPWIHRFASAILSQRRPQSQLPSQSPSCGNHFPKTLHLFTSFSYLVLGQRCSSFLDKLPLLSTAEWQLVEKTRTPLSQNKAYSREFWAKLGKKIDVKFLPCALNGMGLGQLQVACRVRYKTMSWAVCLKALKGSFSQITTKFNLEPFLSYTCH